MYARISTWRARPEDFEALSREVAPMVAELQRQAGYVGGYEVRTTPETMTFITLWQDEARMQEASGKIGDLMRPFIEAGRIELADIKNGPAEPWS